MTLRRHYWTNGRGGRCVWRREVVDAYFAAAHDGDLDALVTVLGPDVVLRNHRRYRIVERPGAEQVSRGALNARKLAPMVRTALVNAGAGARRSLRAPALASDRRCCKSCRA